MTSGFGLVVRFTMRDAESADAFDALVADTLQGIKQQEQGTLVYVNHEIPDEPNVRIFYELYESRSAFDAHEEEPHVKHFLHAREQYVVRTDVTFLSAVDGKVQAQQ